jgi:hypothetical protein
MLAARANKTIARTQLLTFIGIPSRQGWGRIIVADCGKDKTAIAISPRLSWLWAVHASTNGGVEHGILPESPFKIIALCGSKTAIQALQPSLPGGMRFEARNNLERSRSSAETAWMKV